MCLGNLSLIAILGENQMVAAKTSANCPDEIQMENFDCKITLGEAMLGTVPKNREVFKAHILTKIPDDERTPEQQEEVDSVQNIEERGSTGFMHDREGKPFILSYMIRGCLKAAADALRDQSNVAALESKVTKYVMIGPRRLHFDLDDAMGEEELAEYLPGVVFPDEAMRKSGMLLPYFERPLRAKTMQGPRVTLVRSDVIPPGARLHCNIKILKNKWLDEKVLRFLFQYGLFHGLGQWRTGDFGKFSYELEKIGQTEEFNGKNEEEEGAEKVKKAKKANKAKKDNEAHQAFERPDLPKDDTGPDSIA